MTRGLTLRRARSVFVMAVVIAAGTANAGGSAPMPSQGGSTGHPAVSSIWTRAAAHAQVPARTLYAIALQESGLRWRDGRIRPWPWTLNSPHGPMRFRTKAEAQTALERLKAQGTCNIDIGLMQVNWCAHRHRFAHLDWLDPETNIRMAAMILREARESTALPTLGVGRYHSWNTQRAIDYASRVTAWTRRIPDHGI